MGCISSKKSISVLETLYFHPIESQLGLSSIHCQEIDHTFYRFSKNSFLTPTHLNLAISSLNLSQPSGFFSCLLESGKYSVKKLSDLGILLGKGSVKEKAETLFENYDSALCGTLDIRDVQVMIRDLVEISCELVAGFVCRVHEEDEELQRYWKKIRIVKNFIVSRLLEELIGDGLGVDKKGFVRNAEEKGIALFSMKGIRGMCVEAYKQHLKPLEEMIGGKWLAGESFMLRRMSLSGVEGDLRHHNRNHTY